jgi:hypothetical protein
LNFALQQSRFSTYACEIAEGNPEDSFFSSGGQDKNRTIRYHQHWGPGKFWKFIYCVEQIASEDLLIRIEHAFQTSPLVAESHGRIMPFVTSDGASRKLVTGATLKRRIQH